MSASRRPAAFAWLSPVLSKIKICDAGHPRDRYECKHCSRMGKLRVKGIRRGVRSLEVVRGVEWEESRVVVVVIAAVIVAASPNSEEEELVG